jgi:hypothetical protein
MKKYLLAGILVLMMAVTVFASDYGAPTGKVVNVVFAPESGVKTLMSAQTTTGDSSLGGIDMGYTGKYFTCYSSWTTSATSNTIYILGSIDNSVWTATADALATITMTSSPKYWAAPFTGFRYLKTYWASRTGGSASSDLTVKCIEGGN